MLGGLGGPVGGDAVGCTLGRFVPRMLAVRLVVEVGEEDDEGDGIADECPLHPSGERTACVERVGGVADGDVELDLKNIINTQR